MNRRIKKVPAEFGPEVRFEVCPENAVSFRTERENALEQLKTRLLASRLDEVWDPGQNLLLRRAANEAAALARVTLYPALVFPLLFEETVVAAQLRSARESDVKRELLGA